VSAGRHRAWDTDDLPAPRTPADEWPSPALSSAAWPAGGWSGESADLGTAAVDLYRRGGSRRYSWSGSFSATSPC
jgi:hypothetical protein